MRVLIENKLSNFEDADRALLCFNRLEKLRLEACIARELRVFRAT